MMHRLRGWYLNLWRDVWCFLTGHRFCSWQDGHDGTYWQSCNKCYHTRTLPYIEMLLEQRKRRNEAHGPSA